MYKNNSIRVPDNVKLLYCNKKQILSLFGRQANKSIFIKTKLKLSRNHIKVTKIPTFYMSNKNIKQTKSFQYLTVSEIRKSILETSFIFFGKLKIIGVGYRLYTVKNYEDKLLFFKLGFSHLIYYKIPENIKIIILKFINVFIIGNCLSDVFDTLAKMRFLKMPEPYKGKGIRYSKERIKLKKGKRA